MPTIGWIDALRQYNAGMPSWCVPRKGTPGYESVMRIRRGEEQPKSFKEVLADLERKTSGKPKGEKKSMKIDLTTQSATLPTLDEAPKMDRPPTKSSTSNNKAMAVVPVNYVAEGGSQKESAKKEESKMDLTPMKEADSVEKNAQRLREFAKAGVLYYKTKGGARVGSGGGDFTFFVRTGDEFVRIAKVFVGSGSSTQETFESRALFSNTRNQTYTSKKLGEITKATQELFAKRKFA